MTKKNKPFFLTFLWWSTLFIGLIIGIFSQSIPEIKFYTDKITQPIERSDSFQQIMNQLFPFSDSYHFANQKLQSSHYQEINPHPGQPLSSFIIHRPSYSLAYDARHHNPAWVYEHLTEESVTGDVNHSHFSFKEDENIPVHLRSILDDYRGKGLDQGYMAPAANHRSTLATIKDTFYLTNICPQCPHFSRYYWAKIEKHIRDLTKEYRHIYVITGPLYLPYDEGSRRFVKYQVIGSNDVAVPSHFFKVIVLDNLKDPLEVRAYVLPNTVIPANTPLENFRTTVQKIEKAAGLILFNQNP